ncbi:hypothetical protein [Shouchella hunanensis]|uniref:Uncharacterized protein n=1 Tax=Shouchella hunanensis TaxID=766894 RepID=A0ABY7W670_9BACI|nr:hypothetical protein [Shouchella hunanensis]WDF02938.1 hypothetical protein PQ477_15740 [Shouchella hunanensis]
MQLLLGCLGLIIGVILLIVVAMFIGAILLWILNGIMFLGTWGALIAGIFLIVVIGRNLIIKNKTDLKQLIVWAVVLFLVFGLGRGIQPKLHNYLTTSKDETEVETVVADSSIDEIDEEDQSQPEITDIDKKNEDMKDENDDSEEEEQVIEDDTEKEDEEIETNEQDTELIQRISDRFDHFMETVDLVESIKFSTSGGEINTNRYYVFIINEVKMYTEEEKLYLIEELAPVIKGIVAHEKGEEDFPYVYFRYADDTKFAEPKIWGDGYNIKK